MIIFTFLSMTIYLGAIATLWSEGNFSSFLGEMIALWIIAVVIIVFDILILNLNLLHLYLIAKGLTTYELIMQERQTKRL